MSSKKIAVYSGVVPSTTFIERLIDGIAIHGDLVYLFGWQQKKRSYAKNVKQFTYGNKWNKLCILFRYSILLSLFQTFDKKKLDAIIEAKNENKNALKIKYYPVLYHRPDVFHLQWAKSIEDWIWVQEFGVKLILSLRGTHITISPIGNDYWKDLYKQLFPSVDGFHAVSNATKIIAEQYGADKTKIQTVYSGLDFEKLPFVLKEKINSPLKIVSIGRSHWTKGYHYALDAFSILKEQQFLFDYSIVGICVDEELLTQRSQFYLSESIHFVSQIPFEAVLSIIRESDVLLLSSVEEGIANVVLEAMALGTLVVTTNCGGMNEVIVDGENGFLIPIRNPQAIAEAIQKIAALSIEDYQKMSLSALKTIENQHSHQKMITDMIALYETVLKEPS